MTAPVYSAQDYANGFVNLLPRGTAWSRDPENGNINYVTALAQVWGLISQNTNLLMFGESDPRTTSLMLPDWLANYNLPDPCLTEPQTTQQQQAALLFRILLQGGASPQFFITLAASIGYTITITEYKLFRAGIARCGSTPLMDPSAAVQWTVNVTIPAVYYFRAGQGQCGVTPLCSFQDAADLECILRRFKPAHTILNFSYTPQVVH